MAPKRTIPLRGVPGPLGQMSDLDTFAAGATRSPQSEEIIYPWQKPYVREDVVKQLLLKMPEPLYLKLKYISSYSPYTMTSFILEKLVPEVERELARMGYGQKALWMVNEGDRGG
jgi:hypothetical protein